MRRCLDHISSLSKRVADTASITVSALACSRYLRSASTQGLANRSTQADLSVLVDPRNKFTKTYGPPTSSELLRLAIFCIAIEIRVSNSACICAAVPNHSPHRMNRVVRAFEQIPEFSPTSHFIGWYFARVNRCKYHGVTRNFVWILGLEERPRWCLAGAADSGEYADVAAFLASERAAYITGSVIRVDGGMITSI